MLVSSEAFSVVPGQVSGMDYLRNPRLYKGLGLSIEERQSLGIHGLLPARVKTQQEQAEHSMRNLRRFEDPLNKYRIKDNGCLIGRSMVRSINWLGRQFF